MKKFFKWAGIVLGSLILLLALAAAYLNYSAKSRLVKYYDIQPKAIAIPVDSASIAEGQKWVESYCTGCHGSHLEGSTIFDSPDLGTICSSNLTPGAGGIGKKYADADWVRAIRHGVNNEGRPLLVMPAKDFQYLSDEHLGQIIAYLKTLQPVDKTWAKTHTTFLCNVLFATGAFGDALNAETIDHNSPSHYAPPKAATVEYGDYLVKTAGCRTCHGPQLNGGKDPNPDAPMGPNLTPGGPLAAWGAEGFIKALRTGITPTGKEINGEFMPWKNVGHLDDIQLEAIYTYLMKQPRLATADIKK